MAGHQLHGMCCNEELAKVGTATAKGIDPTRWRPLTADEVLRRLMLACCALDEARLDPQYYDDNAEYLGGIPQYPDNWSEGSFVKEVKAYLGARGAVTMSEVALTALARQSTMQQGTVAQPSALAP
jgi:hypothetical protein